MGIWLTLAEGIGIWVIWLLVVWKAGWISASRMIEKKELSGGETNMIERTIFTSEELKEHLGITSSERGWNEFLLPWLVTNGHVRLCKGRSRYFYRVRG
jgi:hypothetical protein